MPIAHVYTVLDKKVRREKGQDNKKNINKLACFKKEDVLSNPYNLIRDNKHVLKLHN